MPSLRGYPDDWEIEQNYTSRKNDLMKINYGGERYVLKRYSLKFIHNLELEEEILIQCTERGLKVPGVKETRRDGLILEYIPGENCKQVFLDGDKGKKKETLYRIAGWLFDFHKAFDFKRRRGDSILANFILSRRDIYGIDFEESVEGDYLRDLGDLCTSVLRLKPAFTKSRFSMVKYFLDEYFSLSGLEEIDMTEQLAGSLLHYAKYSSMGDLMEGWAEKIRENGLASR